MPMGTYQSNVMTFGLRNAPAMFSRLMERDFKEWKEAWAPDQFYPRRPGVEGEEEDEKQTIGVSYMDDFLIGSPNTKRGRRDHSLCTHDLLARMALKKYYLRPAKCIWMQPTMDLLGMKIEEGGTMRIDPTKLDRIRKWPRVLKDKKDVQRTMGILQYNKAFVPGFSHMARPIFETIKKGTKFQWTKTAELALDRIINIMTHDPTVAQPNPHKLFEVEIDASNYATGAVLIQRDNQGKKVTVGYESEALTVAERNYDIYDQEFLSLIRAFRKWRHYLEGAPKHIKIWTDHANLARHREPNILNGRIVTGTRERVWEHPLDRGKFWEPAHFCVFCLCLIILSLSDVSSDAPMSYLSKLY